LLTWAVDTRSTAARSEVNVSAKSAESRVKGSSSSSSSSSSRSSSSIVVTPFLVNFLLTWEAGTRSTVARSVVNVSASSALSRVKGATSRASSRMLRGGALGRSGGVVTGAEPTDQWLQPATLVGRTRKRQPGGGHRIDLMWTPPEGSCGRGGGEHRSSTVYLDIYICMCMYMYVYVCMYTCMDVCIYIYMCTPPEGSCGRGGGEHSVIQYMHIFWIYRCMYMYVYVSPPR